MFDVEYKFSSDPQRYITFSHLVVKKGMSFYFVILWYKKEGKLLNVSKNNNLSINNFK